MQKKFYRNFFMNLFRNYSSTRHSDKFTADDCIMDVKKPVLISNSYKIIPGLIIFTYV